MIINCLVKPKSEIKYMTFELGGKILVNDDIILANFDPTWAYDHFVTVNQNRDFFGQWLAWVDTIQTEHDSLEYIYTKIENQKNGNTIAFHILFKGLLVGQITMFGMKEGGYNCELGYWLDKSYNGMGIMTQSVMSILKFGFNVLNLNRIVIKSSTYNLKSQAIPLRLGFIYEGTLRQSTFIRGKHLDSNVYSILKHEYFELYN
jgi:ribosomal-protein-serine acetyltransferase